MFTHTCVFAVTQIMQTVLEVLWTIIVQRETAFVLLLYKYSQYSQQTRMGAVSLVIDTSEENGGSVTFVIDIADKNGGSVTLSLTQQTRMEAVLYCH